jgi:hypothetical protein
MQRPVLPELTLLSSLPFNHNLSCVNCELARMEVVERRSSWESVTESDELVGRIKGTSRFPQYYQSHQFTQILLYSVLRQPYFDDRDIDGRAASCFKDLRIRHNSFW